MLFVSVMKDMKVIHGWKTVDFVFPSSASKHAMIRAGHFVPGNSLILDADYWQDGNYCVNNHKN